MEDKTNVIHNKRVLDSFIHEDQVIEIVMTKHGHYRILEDKNISLDSFQKVIKSIGEAEYKNHFQNAQKCINKSAKDWRNHIDYVISIYDVIHGIVIMLGIHPHLNRITIVTIIPRINNVSSNSIYGCYRVDNKFTTSKRFNYEIPNCIRMKNIKIA